MDLTRGSTTLGSGALNSYVYLPRDAFDVDYFSEIHVTLSGDHTAYSDAFNSLMEEMAETLEPHLDPLIMDRYHQLKKDAEAEYAKGYGEYSDGYNEYMQGMKDAYDELQGAFIQLQTGQNEIDENRKKLDDGFKELEKAQKELNKGCYHSSAPPFFLSIAINKTRFIAAIMRQSAIDENPIAKIFISIIAINVAPR
jgi:putative ABC transport system permease protein